MVLFGCGSLGGEHQEAVVRADEVYCNRLVVVSEDGRERFVVQAELGKHLVGRFEYNDGASVYLGSLDGKRALIGMQQRGGNYVEICTGSEAGDPGIVIFSPEWDCGIWLTLHESGVPQIRRVGKNFRDIDPGAPR